MGYSQAVKMDVRAFRDLEMTACRKRPNVGVHQEHQECRRQLCRPISPYFRSRFRHALGKTECQRRNFEAFKVGPNRNDADDSGTDEQLKLVPRDSGLQAKVPLDQLFHKLFRCRNLRVLEQSYWVMNCWTQPPFSDRESSLPH